MPLHTLLLVDDNIETQGKIRAMFAGEPIQLIVSENGHRALDHIQANPPDIILANVAARGVDGYALAHYVSQRSHLRSIPVLLLTKSRSSVDEARIDAAGAYGFLTEPFHPAAVVARVKAALGITADRDLQLAGPGSPPELSGELASAFDAIDATMKGRRHTEAAVTPDVLAQIVADAVTRAIDAYDRARGLPPDPARDAIIAGVRGVGPPAAVSQPADPPVLRKAEVDRLLGEMGIDDIEFEERPALAPDPPYVVEQREMLADMGVSDFDFEDASRHVETRAFETNPLPEPASAREDSGELRRDRADLSAVASAEAEADFGRKGGPEPAPAAPPIELPVEDLEDGFSWLADELHTHLPKRTTEPVPEPAPDPDPEPEPEPSPLPAAAVAAEPPAPPLRAAVESTRPGFLARLASWMQPKPAPPAVPEVIEKAPEPTPEPEPERPTEPEAPAPEPVRVPVTPPKPRPLVEDPNEIRFTFDPIPPVPPRLPREPRKTK